MRTPHYGIVTNLNETAHLKSQTFANGKQTKIEQKFSEFVFNITRTLEKQKLVNSMMEEAAFNTHPHSVIFTKKC